MKPVADIGRDGGGDIPLNFCVDVVEQVTSVIRASLKTQVTVPPPPASNPVQIPAMYMNTYMYNEKH